jgi:hypothetical protein
VTGTVWSCSRPDCNHRAFVVSKEGKKNRTFVVGGEHTKSISHTVSCHVVVELSRFIVEQAGK